MNKAKYILSVLAIAFITTSAFAQQSVEAKKENFNKALQIQAIKAANENSFKLKNKKVEISAEKVNQIINIVENSDQFSEQEVNFIKESFQKDRADLAVFMILSKALNQDSQKQEKTTASEKKTEEGSWLSAILGGKYPGETDDSYRYRMEMKKYPAAQPFK